MSHKSNLRAYLDYKTREALREARKRSPQSFLDEKAKRRDKWDALLTSPRTQAWLAQNDPERGLASRPSSRRVSKTPQCEVMEAPDAYQKRLETAWPIIKKTK